MVYVEHPYFERNLGGHYTPSKSFSGFVDGGAIVAWRYNWLEVERPLIYSKYSKLQHYTYGRSALFFGIITWDKRQS